MGYFDAGIFNIESECFKLPEECILCKKTVPGASTTRFWSGDVVCNACLKDYLESVAGDFVDEYVYANRSEYLNRWFSSLPVEEKERILRNEYSKQKVQESILGIDELAKDRVDFCREDLKFLEFVKEKLI